jgi:hypothetical protein
MERVPKKRNVISLETKYDIIQKSKEGVTVSKLSKDFNLATSTICTILAEKEKYIQAIEDNALRDRKRLKMSTYPKLEEAMAMWFNQTTNNTNTVIGGQEILEQATKYAIFLGYDNFKASNGWLENFQKRNNIKLKITVGEAGLVDQEVVSNWINNILPNQIKGYHPRDIFNADETSKYYRALPNKTMTYKGKLFNYYAYIHVSFNLF